MKISPKKILNITNFVGSRYSDDFEEEEEKRWRRENERWNWRWKGFFLAIKIIRNHPKTMKKVIGKNGVSLKMAGPLRENATGFTNFL